MQIYKNISQVRFGNHIFNVRFFAFILLATVLSGTISCVFFGSKARSMTEMVYCPLTKKLQPVNPSPEIPPAFSLDEICAAGSEKARLALAISENLIFKSISLNRKNLENLAFDFWQKGKTAFDVLPSAPDAPEKAAIKSFSPASGFGGNFDIKIFWKTTERFAFQIQPRPPTVVRPSAHAFIIVRKLDRASSRLAPRAPPFTV